MSEPCFSPARTPRISVVVLNYNGLQWLPRCFDSLAHQTIFSEIEVILTDNNSSDGSVKFTDDWFKRTGAKGRVVQNGSNLFYCGANNNGAAAATGEYLLFLNNDTWLEPDCLENLYLETVQAGAEGASPLVQDYDDDAFQCGGDVGLDLLGCVTSGSQPEQVQPTFAAPGMSLLIKIETFRRIGGFPPEILIYADETDLSWRIWISGGKIVSVPTARVHHRGAAVVNPEGRTKVVESRTTDFKRFLANRNGLLLLLKNSQHILLLLVFTHLLLLLAEAVVMLVLVRRWSYVRKSYLSAITAAFGMHRHVREWRRRISGFRRRGDFYMLRFLKLKPARWDEVKRLFQFGAPKVDAR
jgi:GT2 family glycosyltransferase